MKDWTKILAEYSSGEESDKNDTLNVEMVKKNAPKIAELMRNFAPMGETEPSPPEGMNAIPEPIKKGLLNAISDSVRRSSEFQKEHASTNCSETVDKRHDENSNTNKA